MQAFRIWILFTGYVIIEVEGVNIEKFINICTHRQLVLLDVVREGNKLVLKMAAKRFKMIRDVAKKTNCKVKILHKRGFLFWFRKYKKRKAFVLGLFVFLAIFALLWSYIWDIELDCDSSISKRDVIEYLANNNIKVGSIKYSLDTKKMENDLIVHFDNLSWVNVKIQGTKLVINIATRTKIPEIIDKNTPCDIIAMRDGIITKVLVKNGMEVVKIGDAVLKGDVLISGIVEPQTEFGETRVVHAIGSVYANTLHEHKEEVSCVTTKKIYTGCVFKEYTVSVLEKQVFKFKFGNKPNNYTKTTKVTKLRLLKNFVIPIQIKQEKREYYNKHQEVVTMYKARLNAAMRAKNAILKEIPQDATILKQSVNYFEDNGKIFVNVIMETSEQIGKEELTEVGVKD